MCDQYEPIVYEILPPDDWNTQEAQETIREILAAVRRFISEVQQ